MGEEQSGFPPRRKVPERAERFCHAHNITQEQKEAQSE